MEKWRAPSTEFQCIPAALARHAVAGPKAKTDSIPFQNFLQEKGLPLRLSQSH